MTNWLPARAALAGFAAAVCAAAAAPALAATLMTDNGTPLAYAVHNMPATPDGHLLSMDTHPAGFLVDLTSSSIIHNNGNSGGFAEVTGPGPSGGAGFADLTIDPQDPLAGFSAFKFKLVVPGPLTSGPTVPNGYQTDYVFDTRVFFTQGGFQDFLGTAWTTPGRYVITADPNQTISKILLSNLVGTSTKQNQPTLTGGYNFEGIKQMSFDGAGVPEPATWAMMIGGFGLAGAMLRRRRAAYAA